MAWSKPAPDKEHEIVTAGYAGPERRERDDGPWWASLVAKAEKIGYAGIAAFLIYVGATVLTSDVSSIKGSMALHLDSSDKMSKTIESMGRVMVQQCVNTATTEAKKDACFVAVAFAPVRDPK